MRRRAFEKRKRREEIHLVGIRNEIRGAVGADPIENPYDTSPARQDTGKGEAARKEMLRRMDFSGTEPMSPEDLDQLQ